MLSRVNSAGHITGNHLGVLHDRIRRRPPHRMRAQRLRRQIQRPLTQHHARAVLPHDVPRHLGRHLNSPVKHPAPAGQPTRLLSGHHANLRHRPRLRGVIHRRGGHQRHPLGQIQLQHRKRLTLMHIHRTRETLPGRSRIIHCAQQHARRLIHQPHLRATRPANIRQRRRRLRLCPKPPRGPRTQILRLGQLARHLNGPLAKPQPAVVLGQRLLSSCRQQMPRHYIRVLRVNHAGLNRGVKHMLRVMHHKRVQRVVPGDQHRQPLVPGPARTPGLLPQRRQRARPPRDHHHVQPADVNPQLQRARRGHRPQLAPAQTRLQSPALLRQVPAPVGRDRGGQLRRYPPHLVTYRVRQRLGSRARRNERNRPHPRARRIHQHACGLTDRRPALRLLTSHHRWLPQKKRASSLRRRIFRHRIRLPARKPAKRSRRVGHRRRRPHHRGPRPIQRRHPQQTAQHQRHMRPEHTSVPVRLVNNHKPQVLKPPAKPLMTRQNAAVQHIGIGENDVAVLPGPLPVRLRGVAIETARPHPLQRQRHELRQLIVPQRLRRGNI